MNKIVLKSGQLFKLDNGKEFLVYITGVYKIVNDELEFIEETCGFCTKNCNNDWCVTKKINNEKN